MSVVEIIALLVIAAVCGALGQAISGSSRGGLLVSIALGFVGALFGTWIARELGLPELFVIKIEDVDFPVVWSIIGSALFVALVSLLMRGGKRKR
jgi:uncharacterized membrane protein YeaQ/YmgE (transglycosylase-associated protein family)